MQRFSEVTITVGNKAEGTQDCIEYLKKAGSLLRLISKLAEQEKRAAEPTKFKFTENPAPPIQITR